MNVLHQIAAALRGELKPIIDERDKAQSELAVVRAEVQTLNAQLATLTGERDSARKAETELRAEFDKFKADDEARVSVAAAAQVAALGMKPVAMTAKDNETSKKVPANLKGLARAVAANQIQSK